MTQIDCLPGPVRLSHKHTDVCPIKVEEDLLEMKVSLVGKKKKKFFAARSWLVNISWWSSSHAWVLACASWVNGMFACHIHGNQTLLCFSPLLHRLGKIRILRRPPSRDLVLAPLPPSHLSPPECTFCICICQRATSGCVHRPPSLLPLAVSPPFWHGGPSRLCAHASRVWMSPGSVFCTVSWMWAILSGVYS